MADRTANADAARDRETGPARRRRLRVLLTIDLGVGALLLVSWFSIPLLITHIVVGSAFALLVGVHLLTRPRLISGLLRARRRSPRRSPARRRWAADVVLGLATLGATVTGFAQWAGVAPGPVNGLHSMTSGVLFAFAIRHVWVRRRALRARFARRRPADEQPPSTA